MAIVGVVGLSGSGKSTVIAGYAARGFVVLDDVGTAGDWRANADKVRQHADEGRDVVVSDILFCCATAEAVSLCPQIKTTFSGREEFERWVGHPFSWVFFENDPWRCAKNCLRRKMGGRLDRNLDFEVTLILILNRVYQPPGDALDVHDPDCPAV